MCKRGVNTKSGVGRDILWTDCLEGLIAQSLAPQGVNGLLTLIDRLRQLAWTNRRGHSASMSLNLTLAIGGALLIFAAFCGWRGSRPPNPLKGARMAPWRPLMVLSAAGVLVLIVHLGTLLRGE